MKLKTYMKSEGITVTGLAKRVGVSGRSIINYRNGVIPTGRIIKKIVRATGGKVAAVDLIG